MLNKKFILITLISLLVLSIIAQGWTAPNPPPDDGSDEELPPGTPPRTYDSTFEIAQVKVIVDGKSETITNSGGKIGKEAKEKSNIDFEIEVKNIFNKEIRNINVEVTLKDIDEGDDLKEDSSISKLNPQDSQEADVNFDLPLRVDDGSYDVKIHIEGKDEDNNRHIKDWMLTLEVKKEKNNVIIQKAALYPSSLQCSRIAQLTANILNLGRDDEEVKIEVKSEELGISLQEKNIDLDTGTDNDAEYEKIFKLDIPSDIAEGTYPINIKVYYNQDRFARAKDLNLVIEDCNQMMQAESILLKTAQQSQQKTTSTTQQKAPQQKTTITYAYREPFVLLLTLFLIILIGLIIFLGGAIIIKLKK